MFNFSVTVRLHPDVFTSNFAMANLAGIESLMIRPLQPFGGKPEELEDFYERFHSYLGIMDATLNPILASAEEQAQEIKDADLNFGEEGITAETMVA